MDNKDKYVLNKIYAHIVSVLKYCENSTGLEEFNEEEADIWNEEQDCSWI